MAVWFRPREQRQSQAGLFGWPGPRMPLQYAQYSEINADRVDTALQSVAVASAVDLIASLGSELPIDVYRGAGAAKEQLPVPSWLRDPGGDGYGLQDWCYRALISWLLRGNVYGDVLDRGPGGSYMKQAELLHPDRVTGSMSDGAPVWYVNGQEIKAERFLHRRAYQIPGQILGRSPIAYHATTIGVTLASTQFGWQWFRDGGHPSGILRNTEVPLDAEGTVKTAKDRFLAALRGSREPIVLGKGWEWEQIQVNPDESQFLETMGYSEAQSARIFGPGIAEVLGYAVKGVSLTYANIQDRDLHLLKYSIGKWLRRLERLLTDFLPRPQYVLLNRDALLETNTLQRYQAHQSALAAKWKVPNEVREKEDLAPVPWGNVPIDVAAPPEPEPEPTPDEGEEEGED